MKKLCLILSLLLLLSLLGCGASDPAPAPDPEEAPVVEQTEPEETTPPAAEQPEETTPPTEEEPEPAPTEPPAETQPTASIVDTKYYTITLPNSWLGKCVCNIFQQPSGTYILSVHESQAFLDFGGGKMFQLMLMPTSDDTYKDFPSYELIASLDTPDGSFHVIALFPTDAQFTEETIDTYNEMEPEMKDVLYSISPKEGIEMAMP